MLRVLFSSRFPRLRRYALGITMLGIMRRLLRIIWLAMVLFRFYVSVVTS